MSVAKLVVVGALHHDIVVEVERQPELGETLMGSSWQPKFGGKGGNQAAAAAKAGAAVAMIGAVGKDGFGQVLLAGLEAAAIDTTEVRQVDHVGSGMSVAIQDSDGDYAAVIVSGANRSLKASDVAASAHWQNASTLILQNEIPEAINHTAAVAARARGMTVVWNAAPARKDTVGLMAATDVLIVNAIEARQMTGVAVDSLGEALRAARALKALGVPIAVVTAGAAGAAAIGCGCEAIEVPAQAVDAPKTHGAGDVFTGVLATALLQGSDLEDALQAASLAAAAHVGGED